MSINQLNAQIKLMEIWKLIKIEDYPLPIKTQLPSETGVTTRADANKRPCEIGVSLLTKFAVNPKLVHTFIYLDANMADNLQLQNK